MNARNTDRSSRPDRSGVRPVTRRVLQDKYGAPNFRDRLGSLKRRWPRREPGASAEGGPGEQSRRTPSQRQQGTPQWWVMKASSKVVRVKYSLPLVMVAAAVLWKKHRRADALYLLGTVAAGQSIDGLLKKTIDERRPEQGGAGKEPDSSFPSDHGIYTASLGVASVLLSWSSTYRYLALIVGPGLSLLSGLSRLYFRRHHLRDVLTGWAIGGTVAFAGRLLRDRQVRRRQETA